ncbi:hypothetical protein [Dysgonomonas sp. 520]|uniref:hypothetical protein n=1 Tax=Dysgonomonas sp. 520 TaxID=2302931 RepID=UPI0016283EF0|nr:hypothetical protein [Dysgonomonas sp. 520]
MSQIKGIENMSVNDIRRELDNGAKFVIFTYVISLLVVSYKRSSSIHFVKPGDAKIAKGWPYFLISLIMGWWGLPWGPIYTFQAFYYAFAGKNVTDEVMASLSLTEGAQYDENATNTGGYNLDNGRNNGYGMNDMINRNNQE